MPNVNDYINEVKQIIKECGPFDEMSLYRADEYQALMREYKAINTKIKRMLGKGNTSVMREQDVLINRLFSIKTDCGYHQGYSDCHIFYMACHIKEIKDMNKKLKDVKTS